mgnify:CR=1 FL=1
MTAVCCALIICFISLYTSISYTVQLQLHTTHHTALHRERIEHTFTNTAGLQNPHGVEEDVEHTVLENTLTFQAGLLQDKLATEQMQQDSMSKYGMNPYSSTLNAPVLDGGLDEESSEALVICLAIAGLTLVPQLLGN